MIEEQTIPADAEPAPRHAAGDTAAMEASAQCVQCGLCLPQCPTYRIAHNEAESPRGRLMLIHALAQGQLEPTATLAAHLDHCLHCNSCTAMCPAKVPYDRVIDAAKNYLRQKDKKTLPFWLELITTSRVARALALWAAAFVALKPIRPFAQFVANKLALGALLKMLPDVKFEQCLPIKCNGNGNSTNKKTVALFTGCVAQITDRETLHNSARLLQAAGYAVTIPRGQTCCGALHAHNGYGEKARTLIQHNQTAFASHENLISCASGCGEFLYAQLSQPVNDIGAFLESHLSRNQGASLKFAPLAERVVVHTPCTLRHRFDPDATVSLLRRIPDCNIVPLPSKGMCCGAAGMNMLNAPDTAIALGKQLLAQVRASGDSRILITSNIGCAMHLRRIIKDSEDIKDKLTVMHPATLLWKQLQK